MKLNTVFVDTMPQTRKRKTKETVESEIQEKEKKILSRVSNPWKRKSNEISSISELKTAKNTFNSADVGDSTDTPDIKSNDLSIKPKKSKVKNFSTSKNETKSRKTRNNSNKNSVKNSIHSSTLDENRDKNENCLSLKTDPKLKKGKVLKKEKLEDKEHENRILYQSCTSSDSRILSETTLDSKFNIAVKSESTNEDCKNIDDSSSESEWEEVEENGELSLDDYKPVIPKEGVEITIDCPELHVRKRKKKKFDENEWIRLHVNRIRKDIQLSIHKTHLLCLLAHGFYVNKVLNSDTLKALALSVIPEDFFSVCSSKKIDKIDLCGLEKIVLWFQQAFTFDDEKTAFLNLFSSLINNFQEKKSLNSTEYNLMFIAISRVLGFKVRFCISLYPVTHKASNLIKKPKCAETTKETISGDLGESSKGVKKEKKTKVKKEPKFAKQNKKEQKYSDSEVKERKISRPRRLKKKSYKLSSDEEDIDDDDFILEELNSSDEEDKKASKCRSKPKSTPQQNKSNRKVLSSDSEAALSPSSNLADPNRIICWAEVYLKPEKQWISIDCVHNLINDPYGIEEIARHPVSYIVAFDNECFVKDVTRRYCNNYMIDTIKLRVDPEWWEETLEPFCPPNSKLNKEEEKKLDELLVKKPLPHTVQGFKNHPLYALKRHLLKFEAIYPPDAPTAGFMRGEPIYARECVHQLHSRETWLKEARVVRIGEQPYKIVKARPKWDRIAGIMRTDLPLEIFGMWQTEPYEPPIAVNGKVPRNEYGNVELFKPCMLPRGTVHLQLPGLNRIAKKLGIDCSPAVVGFDGHKGSVHPVFDGFIICEEFKETIIAAWDEEQENIRKREEEKREKRIYGNWKKLIKGLLIRERIQLKYHSDKS